VTLREGSGAYVGRALLGGIKKSWEHLSPAEEEKLGGFLRARELSGSIAFCAFIARRAS
jgi:hypothetical protein